MKTLKKITLGIITATAVLLFNCTNEKPAKNEEALKKEKEFAAMVKKDAADRASRDSIENAFRVTLDEIDNNLHMISEKEGAMAVNAIRKGDKNITKRTEILNSIAAINSLLEENKSKMKRLTHQLAISRSDTKKLKKEAEKIQEYMAQKEQEINSLKEQLAQQSTTINELNGKVTDLQASKDLVTANSEMMDKELHKAYYTSGTSTELKKHKVIEKEGGILGLGRTEALAPTAEKSSFTEIDTRKATGIVINGKKPKLITHHPINSYELKKEGKDVEYLTIKDPDKFWSTSKYLVVEVK